MLVLDAKMKSFFLIPPSLFAQMMALRGTVYRQLENRKTQRIIMNNQTYFIKQHFGVGWKEIFKNLLQLRLPVISAKKEWQALQRLQQLNIPVPILAGYGCEGINPARRQSFVLTQELPESVSLEVLGKQWQNTPPTFRFKQQLITEVARIARTLHESGMNHRDFYICHFLLDRQKTQQDKPLLYLIDLHRAQMRRDTPIRWMIKDLAGLYFSSKDIGLTKRDLLRFMQKYRNKSLSLIVTEEDAFWRRVKKRGHKLYREHAR